MKTLSSPVEIRKLRTKLTATKKQLKAEKSAFANDWAKQVQRLTTPPLARSCSMRWSVNCWPNPRTGSPGTDEL